MAKRIVPNRRRSDVSGKAGQEFHQKLTVSDDSKMHIHYAQLVLGLPSTAFQLGMVKHDKLEHDLDTIFCEFWDESVHRVMHRDLRMIPPWGPLE